MKLSDYLVQYLANQGVKHVFLVIGGSCAHIVDSIGRNKSINYICTQHEQAAGMAADANARLTNKLGVAMATSGPGATNLITGLCCSWFDSAPCLFISGQVNVSETKGKRKVRQLGFQETDIVEIVSPLTKYAVMVKKPEKIKYYLDKAFYLAKNGRPGPVWLDIPQNVQHAQINPERLEVFNPQSIDSKINKKILSKQITESLKMISRTVRPIILAGAGIRIGGAEKEFKKFIKLLGWPVVSTWSAKDLLAYDHPQYVGEIGVYGNRGANFAVQNSDLLISIGSRLDSRQTGNQPATFARAAQKIIVDIDKAELSKGQVEADLPINSDAKDFLSTINKKLHQPNETKINPWIKRCAQWKTKYPAIQKKYYQQKKSVNPYVFLEKLSQELPDNSVVVFDCGANTAWSLQTLHAKKNQRFINACGFFPMGYGLPAAIGASFAFPNKQIVCITGDGGMQFNLQELQTIVNYKLPIKIFILNNQSYGLIKQFQDTYFNSRYEATGKGYSCPDFVKIARAYKIDTESIENHHNLEEKVKSVLQKNIAVVCNVKISENQKVIPKLEAAKTADNKYISKPIEDQWPYLERAEFLSNMIINPISKDR